jgi:hypothetical protein
VKRRGGRPRRPEPVEAATFRFDAELLELARVIGLLRGVPMRRLVEDGLREHLDRLLAEDPPLAQAVAELLPHFKRMKATRAAAARTLAGSATKSDPEAGDPGDGYVHGEPGWADK